MTNNIKLLHVSKHFQVLFHYDHKNSRKTEVAFLFGTLFVAINTSPCQHNERPFFNFLKDQTKKFIF